MWIQHHTASFSFISLSFLSLSLYVFEKQTPSWLFMRVHANQEDLLSLFHLIWHSKWQYTMCVCVCVGVGVCVCVCVLLVIWSYCRHGNCSSPPVQFRALLHFRERKFLRIITSVEHIQYFFFNTQYAVKCLNKFSVLSFIVDLKPKINFVFQLV